MAKIRVDHRARYRALQKFVNFSFKLTNKELTIAQKREIYKYYRQFKSFISYPGAIKFYRPRNKQRREAAKKAFGFTGNIKTIPIPVSNPQNVRVDYDKRDGKIILSVKEGVGKRKRYYVAFDQYKLAREPKAEIARTVRLLHGDYFMIRCGDHYAYSAGARDAQAVEETVIEFMKKYNTVNDNHYYRKWLFGMASVEFAREHRRGYKTRAEKAKRQKRAAKRKTRGSN